MFIGKRVRKSFFFFLNHPYQRESNYFFSFWCEPFLKSFLNLLRYCFCFMFWFFGCDACGVLAPRSGIKPTPPALEGEVLTTGPPGKSQKAAVNTVKDLQFPSCVPRCTGTAQQVHEGGTGYFPSSRETHLSNTMLKVVHSFNIRLYYIPSDDIIPLQK